MKKLIRLLTIAAALGTTLATTSCGSKSDDPQAQTQTAVLSGQITPAGSVTTVTATDASGKPTIAIFTSAGVYSFPTLKVGTYTLSFIPAAGYAAPAPVSVTLVAGGTTAPTVTAVLAAASATYTVDGTAMTAAYIFSQGSGNGNFRVLTFTANPGAAPPTITINLDALLPTLGTRTLTTNSNNASYTGLDYVQYSSNYSSGAGVPLGGTFTISSISTSPRVFSGTFSFVGTGLNALPASPAIRNITSGMFINVPY